MYEDLVAGLRICADGETSCSGCAYSRHDPNDPAYVRYCGIIRDSADAIEDLNRRLSEHTNAVRCLQCIHRRQPDGWCGFLQVRIRDDEFTCGNGERSIAKEFLNRKTVIDTVLDQMEKSNDPAEMRKRLMDIDVPEVKPVTHGTWIPVDDLEDAFDCSECVAMVSRRTNFCPRCGADMRR